MIRIYWNIADTICGVTGGNKRNSAICCFVRVKY